MLLRELKEKILNHSFDSSFFIMSGSDIDFIANEYIQEIARQKDSSIQHFESIEDYLKASKSSSLLIDSNRLYVIEIDKLETLDSEKFGKFLKNVIIKTKSISKEVQEQFKDFIVNVPKLEPWQIEEYVKVKLPGLSPAMIHWLCEVTKYDIYRLSNEADKINIFRKNQQEEIFRELNAEGHYSDLSPLTIFNFTTAIVKRDINGIKMALHELESIDCEPAGFISILLKNFRNVIDIQLNPRATAESLGLTSKQFYAIKNYNCGFYSNNELVSIYDTLTSIDQKLKRGHLDYDKIIDYILIKVLTNSERGVN